MLLHFINGSDAASGSGEVKWRDEPLHKKREVLPRRSFLPLGNHPGRVGGGSYRETSADNGVKLNTETIIFYNIFVLIFITAVVCFSDNDNYLINRFLTRVFFLFNDQRLTSIYISFGAYSPRVSCNISTSGPPQQRKSQMANLNLTAHSFIVMHSGLGWAQPWVSWVSTRSTRNVPRDTVSLLGLIARKSSCFHQHKYLYSIFFATLGLLPPLSQRRLDLNPLLPLHPSPSFLFRSWPYAWNLFSGPWRRPDII